jgi:hypothetical protein
MLDLPFHLLYETHSISFFGRSAPGAGRKRMKRFPEMTLAADRANITGSVTLPDNLGLDLLCLLDRTRRPSVVSGLP